MELHGLATGTQSSYLRAVRNFIPFTCKRDLPLSLTVEDVKTFMHHHLKILLQAPQTINTKRSAIKFLYVNVLDMPCMWFVFLRPEFCRRLPSDSTSRWTPLS